MFRARSDSLRRHFYSSGVSLKLGACQCRRTFRPNEEALKNWPRVKRRLLDMSTSPQCNAVFEAGFNSGFARCIRGGILQQRRIFAGVLVKLQESKVALHFF